MEIVPDSVIDESLLSFGLPPGLVLEDHVIIPSPLYLECGRLVQEWIAPSHFLSKLRFLLSILLFPLSACFLCPLLLYPFQLC